MKEFTIVLVYRNSSDFLYRWIKNYNISRFNCDIVILDSSDDFEKTQEVINKFEEKNVKVIKYKNNKQSNRTYIQKRNEIAKFVNTKYMMMSDVDDIIVWDEIDKHIQFLKKSPGFISSGSPEYFGVINKNKITNKLYGNKFFSYINHQESILHNNNYQRVEFLLENIFSNAYFSINYCIMETKNIKNIIDRFPEFHEIDPLTYEFYFLISLVFQCKLNIMVTPHYIKQIGSSTLSSTLVSQASNFTRITSIKQLQYMQFLLNSFEDKQKCESIWSIFITIIIKFNGNNNSQLSKIKEQLFTNFPFVYFKTKFIFKKIFGIKNLQLINHDDKYKNIFLLKCLKK